MTATAAPHLNGRVPPPPAAYEDLTADLARVPDRLCDATRWVLWRYVLKPGQSKWTKVPIHAESGRPVDGTPPNTGLNLTAALTKAAHLRARGIAVSGLGIALGDGLTGVDLDDCIDEHGQLKPWALKIVNQLDTYAEDSPSRTGLHLLCFGELPPGGRRIGPIEMYDGGRFFTMTGWHFGGTPETVEERAASLAVLHAEVFPSKPPRMPRPAGAGLSVDDAELVRRAGASKDGAKFGRLMDGDTSDYGGDASGADLGFCNLIRFYGGTGDRAQVDRLFRRSRLYRDKWDERHHADGRTYGEGTLDEAMEGDLYDPGAGVDLTGISARTNGTPHGPADTTTTVASRPGPRWHTTDTGNGQRFVAQHGRVVRYSHAWRRWLVWDGTRWLQDDVGSAVALAKRTALSIHAEVADPRLNDDDRKRLSKWAFDSEARGAISAMLGLAESEAGVAVRPDQLDAHKQLLNCPNGTIDLTTGALLPHDPAHLLTKSTGVAYDPALDWRAAAPLWAAFLERIQPDAAVRDYLQKAAGYTLKGTSGERVVLIPYGKGRNGKSTLLEALRDILGDYAVSLPVETLIQQRNDGNRPSNDIARTKGARYVWTRENEEGRRLNESLLKQLTGGMDTVTARFLYQESFDFRPEFTLWFSTNHRPMISGTDDGIWDRIKLVPFLIRIPDDEVDTELPDKFRREELPGILRWAVEGCLLWQQEGLTTPVAVTKATEDYRQDMDVLGRFLEECCYLGTQCSAGSTALHTAYLAWCMDTNEKAISHTAFSTKLADRPGITKSRLGAGVVFSGIGLLAKKEEEKRQGEEKP